MHNFFIQMNVPLWKLYFQEVTLTFDILSQNQWVSSAPHMISSDQVWHIQCQILEIMSKNDIFSNSVFNFLPTGTQINSWCGVQLHQKKTNHMHNQPLGRDTQPAIRWGCNLVPFVCRLPCFWYIFQQILMSNILLALVSEGLLQCKSFNPTHHLPFSLWQQHICQHAHPCKVVLHH